MFCYDHKREPRFRADSSCERFKVACITQVTFVVNTLTHRRFLYNNFFFTQHKSERCQYTGRNRSSCKRILFDCLRVSRVVVKEWTMAKNVILRFISAKGVRHCRRRSSCCKTMVRYFALFILRSMIYAHVWNFCFNVCFINLLWRNLYFFQIGTFQGMLWTPARAEITYSKCSHAIFNSNGN